MIYSKDKSKNLITKIHGKIMDEVVYERKSRVLVYYNPDILEPEYRILDRKVEHIKKMVRDGESQDDIKMQPEKIDMDFLFCSHIIRDYLKSLRL